MVEFFDFRIDSEHHQLPVGGGEKTADGGSSSWEMLPTKHGGCAVGSFERRGSEGAVPRVGG